MSELPKRIAIERVGHFQYSTRFDFSEEINEEELRARLEEVRPLFTWATREAGVDASPGVDERKVNKKEKPDAVSQFGVTKDAFDYLIEITKDPFLLVTKRDQLLTGKEMRYAMNC